MINKVKRHWVITGILAIALVSLGVSVAMASTASGSLTVTATVGDTCVVGSSSLAFGSYSGSQLDGTGTISVTCSANAAYAVDIGNGGNASGGARRMTDGAMVNPNFLIYSLYSDASRMQLWGTGVMGGTDVNGTGSGSAQSINVYGRIPGSQSVPAGNYSDAPAITVTF